MTKSSEENHPLLSLNKHITQVFKETPGQSIQGRLDELTQSLNLQIPSIKMFEETSTQLRQLANIDAFNHRYLNKQLQFFRSTSFFDKSLLNNSRAKPYIDMQTQFAEMATSIKLATDLLGETKVKSLFSETMKAWSLRQSFADLNLDNLSVLREVVQDLNFKEYERGLDEHKIAGNTNDSPDKVKDMTKDELVQVIWSAIESGPQQDKKANGLSDRIKYFLVGVFVAMGQDITQQAITFVLSLLMQLFIGIAVDNHNFNIGKLVSEKISETETVSTVRKLFLNNPGIGYPIGDMAFLRVESHLRTQPNRRSHFSIGGPVSKNTVVFPVERRGNWILIETETKEGFYIGWVEESKVIKFKLDSNSSKIPQEE